MAGRRRRRYCQYASAEARLLASASVATFRVAVIEWVASDGRKDLRALSVQTLDSLAADLSG